MNKQRRNVLKGAGSASVVGVAVMAGLLKPGVAMAEWSRYKIGFEADSLANALAGLDATSAVDSGDIILKTPDIAENGAVVPVEITSKIPGTDSISILAEKNGNPLVADFKLMNGADSYVSTRIKMAATSNVVVIVRAGGKAYRTQKEVKVTIGGCGG